MNEASFDSSKEKLENILREITSNPDVNLQEKKLYLSLGKLLEIYLYENRLEKKGILTKAILDGFEFNGITEQFIRFDQSIS